MASSKNLHSPDDLDRYVHVTSPGVWIALATCIVIVLGLLAWGMFGSVTTSVKATGIVMQGDAICFLDAETISKVHKGNAAMVNDTTAEVYLVGKLPYSREDAANILKSDYLANTIITKDWGYPVYCAGDFSDLSENMPVSMQITTEQMTPISLILKNWE